MTRDLIKVPILISFFFFLFNLKHQKGFIKKDPVSIEKRKKGKKEGGERFEIANVCTSLRFRQAVSCLPNFSTFNSRTVPPLSALVFIQNLKIPLPLFGQASANFPNSFITTKFHEKKRI